MAKSKKGGEEKKDDAGPPADGKKGDKPGSRPTTPLVKKTEEELVEEAIAERDAQEKKEAADAPVLRPGEELFHADMHPAYKPFFKQILTGVPRTTVNMAMERKNLNPEYLDTPKQKIAYRGKPPHKKTALDILAEEEARQAIIREKEELESDLALKNPMDEINWDGPEFQGFVGKIRKAAVYVKKKKEMLEKNAFKYGPPYVDDYGGNLIDECNKVGASFLEVHQMLLDGADPRIPDENDECYHNTPLHYAARYCHARISRMLHKAQCEIDQPNDLGLTPLGTLCMFNQPSPRHHTHLKFVAWLLELGADVNHVDKGGHTALEFAAKHGNVDLVALLLKFKARVKRDAQFISLKTVDLLDPDICEDMTCRQLIKAKFNEELRLENEEKEIKRQQRMEQESKIRDEERRLAIENAHANKHNALNEKHLYEHHLEIEKSKKKARLEAKKKRMAMLEERRNENGSWKKSGPNDWRFVEGAKGKSVSIQGGVYDDALSMNAALEKAHEYSTMNKLWKELVGKDLLTAHDVTDMGYGVDDMKKEDRDREEEMAKFKTPPESARDSDEEANELFADRANETKAAKAAAESGGIKLEGEAPKLRRRMSITGATLKMPALPKVEDE
jgi:ankyrin repeat protein